MADILQVNLVGQEECDVLSFDPKSGALRVLTKPSYRRAPDSTKFEVELNVSDSISAYSTAVFHYSIPGVTSIAPTRTPRAGGTQVVLKGVHLEIGSSRVLRVGDNMCGAIELEKDGSEVRCTTLPAIGDDGNADGDPNAVGDANVDDDADGGQRRHGREVEGGGGAVAGVCYQIDGMQAGNICADGGTTLQFATVDDPQIATMTPLTAPAAGGVMLTAVGTNLHAAVRPQMRVNFSSTSSVRSSQCTASMDGTQLQCMLPASTLTSTFSVDTIVDGGAGAGAGAAAGLEAIVHYRFDGAAASGSITYFPNPTITDVAPLSGAVNAVVRITGAGLLRAGTPTVTIGNATAIVSNAADDSLFVIVPLNTGNGSAAVVVVSLGDWMFTNPAPFVYTGDAQNTVVNNTIVLQSTGGIGGSTAGGVLGGMLLLGVVVFAVVRLRQKQALAVVLTRMNLLESQVVEVCKQGFAELQNDFAFSRDFALDGSSADLGQRDYGEFVSKVLFTHTATHPTPAASAGPGYSEPIKIFRRLLGSKDFVVAFVGALEDGGSEFAIKDRCHVAALLQLALHEDSAYGFQVLTALLDVLFERPATTKHPKLALRRTEFVAEKFLTSWLSCQLHSHVSASIARPFFELLHALQAQGEKGPIDAKTGAAMYTLNGDNLLRERVPFVRLSVTVTVPLGTASDPKIELQVNDTDTPGQCVQKAARRLGQELTIDPGKYALVAKGWPNSTHYTDLDESSLCDHDLQLVRVNTLQFHGIKAGAQLELIPVSKMNMPETAPKQKRRFSKASGYLTYTQWHLVKPTEHGSVDAIPSEVFLTYMLTVKGIVQPYVESFIHALFNADSIPNTVMALLSYLHAKTTSLELVDPDVAHVWKNNALPLRFYVNLVKNPDFVFGAATAPLISSNMSVIAQVIMDSCSVSEQHLTASSPANKLLYRSDVRGYKAVVKDYYNVGGADGFRTDFVPPAPGQAQAAPITADSAALALLRFVDPHKDRIAGVLLSSGKGAMAAEFSQCCGAVSHGAPDGDQVAVVRRRPKAAAAAADRTTQFMQQKGSMNLGNVDLQQGYLEIAGDRSSIAIDNEMFTEPPTPQAPYGEGARPVSFIGGFDIDVDGDGGEGVGEGAGAGARPTSVYGADGFGAAGFGTDGRPNSFISSV
jgi:plexin A